jgi:hypothetical protein
MKKFSRRGEVLELTTVPYAIITLVVLVILLGLGASILLTTQQAQCTGTVSAGGTGGSTYTWNASAQACNMINATGMRVVENSGTIASNSSFYGMTGVNTFSQWVPTIAIVLAASVVIGLVMAYLVGRRND